MRDDERPKIELGYSSPAQEQQRAEEEEKARRQATEDYNASTFGTRWPYLSTALWMAGTVAANIAILGPLTMVMSRSHFKSLCFVLVEMIVVFVIVVKKNDNDM